MKKKFSLILSLVMLFTIIVLKPSIVAKAADYHNGTNYNYDEVVVGTNNLNNTSSNSAKVGDSLLMPEKGWKRYDDKYSKFVTGFAYRNVDAGVNGMCDYMGSSSSTEEYGSYTLDRPDENSCTFKFTFRGQHLRIMKSMSRSLVARTYAEIVCDGVSFKLNTDNYYKAIVDYVLFEHTFSTFGVHEVVVRQLPPQNPTEQTYPVGVDAIDIDESGEVLDTNSLPQVEPVPLYRYYNGEDHFYTIDKLSSPGNYKLEGIACYVLKSQQGAAVPLYRYYSYWGNHFYTTNYSELSQGNASYKLEKTECYVYNTQQPGTVPVYRCYNGNNHFYTTNLGELGTGSSYKVEGIVFYAFPS